jgi:hypothetical protein
MKQSTITNEVFDHLDRTGKYYIPKKVLENVAWWGDEQQF